MEMIPPERESDSDPGEPTSVSGNPSDSSDSGWVNLGPVEKLPPSKRAIQTLEDRVRQRRAESA